MMKNLIQKIIITLVVFGCTLHYANSADLSFKGAKLGMTLEEFKALPTPFPKEYSGHRNFRVSCLELWNRKTCQYQTLLGKIWGSSSPGFAGIRPGEAKNIYYYFFNDRLMEIKIRIDTDRFDRVYENFMNRYPGGVKEDKMYKNPYGAHVGNRTYVLFYGEQVFLMNKFDNSSREGFIIFKDEVLVAEYEASFNTVNGADDF